MSEANKAVIRRVVEEVVNKHDLSVLSELYPDCVYRTPATGELRGEAHRKFIASVLAAFPDCQETITDQVAEGDKVVTRWTFTGTHKGTFMDVPPTGKRITITGMCIDRIVNGKIVEEWEEWDALGMMHQLGAVPAAKAAAMVVPLSARPSEFPMA